MLANFFVLQRYQQNNWIYFLLEYSYDCFSLLKVLTKCEFFGDLIYFLTNKLLISQIYVWILNLLMLRCNFDAFSLCLEEKCGSVRYETQTLCRWLTRLFYTTPQIFIPLILILSEVHWDTLSRGCSAMNMTAFSITDSFHKW